MFEFGRAPVTCERCGPSHALVRDTATPASLLTCDSCGLTLSTLASLAEGARGAPERKSPQFAVTEW